MMNKDQVIFPCFFERFRRKQPEFSDGRSGKPDSAKRRVPLSVELLHLAQHSPELDLGLRDEVTSGSGMRPRDKRDQQQHRQQQSPLHFFYFLLFVRNPKQK